MTKVAKYAGINPSDDGPSVILNTTKGDFSSAQVTQYFVESKDLKGAIIPSANFEPLPIAISAERTAVALAHVAHNSVQRTLRMDDDRFSGLPWYLTADTYKNGHSFGTTEDSMFFVYAENVDLANPVSMDGSAVEGDIEDMGSNLPRIAERLNRSASNILSIRWNSCTLRRLRIFARPCRRTGSFRGNPGALRRLPCQGFLRHEGSYLPAEPRRRRGTPEALLKIRPGKVPSPLYPAAIPVRR